MDFYSPIQSVYYKGLSIDIKRDDLIDPIISGNKWRKLKWNIAEAKKNDKNHLITFGGAFSNHLIATAALSAKSGFKSTAFVRGEKVNNHMLLLCELYGMDLRFVDRTLYKDKNQLFETYFGDNNSAYFIDEGGAGELAVKGCAEIIGELTTFYQHIVCAAGTGTTVAGLLKGIHLHQKQTKLHVIPVLKPSGFIKEEIETYQKDLSLLRLHPDFHFGGYAKTTDELLKFIKDFASETGVLLDPIYTGKAMFALISLIGHNVVPKSDKILFIHTGGLLGLFGKQEEFREIL